MAGGDIGLLQPSLVRILQPQVLQKHVRLLPKAQESFPPLLVLKQALWGRTQARRQSIPRGTETETEVLSAGMFDSPCSTCRAVFTERCSGEDIPADLGSQALPSAKLYKAN